MSIIKLTYPDGRIEIKVHSFNAKKNKNNIQATYSTDGNHANLKRYMTTKNYIRLINHTHSRLWKKEYHGFYYFFTLTFNHNVCFREASYEFKKFLILFKRIYKQVEYVRTIEHNYYKGLLHIHAIIQLEPIGLFVERPRISNKVMDKLWKHGRYYVENAYDIYGTIEYITTFKKYNLMEYNQKHTNFPRKARIISTSQRFGVLIPKEKVIKETISKQELNEIRNPNKEKFFVRENKHYYHCEITNTQVCCLDKIYIHSKKVI